MSFCLWLTGLPGSGKSTILHELSRILSESGIEAVTLSLDRIRKIITPEFGIAVITIVTSGMVASFF